MNDWQYRTLRSEDPFLISNEGEALHYEMDVYGYQHYTYPDGHDVVVPGSRTHLRTFRLADLEEMGHDPPTQVAVTMRGYPRVMSDEAFALVVTQSDDRDWYPGLHGPGWQDPCWGCLMQNRLSSCGNDPTCHGHYEASFPCDLYHLGTQVIGIDVEPGLPWPAARQALTEWGVRPSFVYDRDLVNGKPRQYCVVIVLDAVCTDLAAVRAVRDAVANLVGTGRRQLDPVLSDDYIFGEYCPNVPVRPYEGGRDIIYSDFGARMSLEELQLAVPQPSGWLSPWEDEGGDTDEYPPNSP